VRLFRRDKENGEGPVVPVTDAAPPVDLMRFERLVQSSIRLRELGIAYEAIETETDAVRAVDGRTGRNVRWKSRNLPGYLGGVAISGGRFLAPSNAGVIGGHPRHGLAAFDPRTRRMTPWAPRLSGTVLALAASDTTLYVGGCFRRVNGQTRL